MPSTPIKCYSTVREALDALAKLVPEDIKHCVCLFIKRTPVYPESRKDPVYGYRVELNFGDDFFVEADAETV